ncbi:transcriptional regulator [Pseudomonas oleovorans]|uniref:Transcriptional regulator n=1 Tax=Ectopseudomonas oleovorans TaxID=301 RepID=A0A2S7FM74_ECTOL|nr:MULTISPECIES: transcriptional regulator [Pseudomonas aeruginosa group]MCR1827858.1 transcriptional regulator [Pseudomonas oleovorans]MDH0568450.1 transcriptional regulator [Pseudomonas oleovorans]PPV39307.1 transcriptional regulator [Pseudomonas oleovorans]RRW32277.1 transcriptional regulator [Pseudomonas oleovorans]TXR36905.1 transcriptional regulator [Pseudomonas mendocina]
MTQQQTIAVITANLPELLTMADLAVMLRRTRSGVDKLRARDPEFPKPLKDGSDRRSRVYFVRSEVEAYLQARLEARQSA